MPDKFDKMSKGNGDYSSFVEHVDETVSDMSEATKKIESLKDEISKKNSSYSAVKKEYAEKVAKEDLEGNIYNSGNSQSIVNEITDSNAIFNEQWNAMYREDIFSEKPAVDIPDKDDVTYRYGNSNNNSSPDNDTRETEHTFDAITFSSTDNGIRFEAIDSYEVVSPMGCTINGELIMAFLKLNIKYKDSDGTDLETLPTIDQLTETKTEYRLMMLSSNSTEWVDAPTDVYDLDGNLIGNLNNTIMSTERNVENLPDELPDNKLYLGWSDINTCLKNIVAFKSTDSNNIFIVYFCTAKKHAITILRFNRYRNCWDAVVNSKFGMDENGYIYEMFKKWFGKDIITCDEAFPVSGAGRSRRNSILTGTYDYYNSSARAVQPFNSLTMDECFVKEDREYKYYATYVMYGIQKIEYIRLNDEVSRTTVDGRNVVTSITKLGPTSSKRIFVFFTYRISKKDGRFEPIACFKKDPLLTECNLDVPVSVPQTDKDCIGWVVNSPFDYHLLGGWWCADPLDTIRIITPALKACTIDNPSEPRISLSYIGQYSSHWGDIGYNDPGQVIVTQLHKITFDLNGLNEERTSVYNKSRYKYSAESTDNHTMKLCSYTAPTRGWSFDNNIAVMAGTNRYPIHYISYNNTTSRGGLCYTADFSIMRLDMGDIHFMPNIVGSVGADDIKYETGFSGMKYLGDISQHAKYNYFPRTNRGNQLQFLEYNGGIWIKNIDTSDTNIYGVIPYGPFSPNALSYTLSNSFFTYLGPIDGKVKESRFLFGKMIVPLIVGTVTNNDWMYNYPRNKTHIALIDLSEIYGAYNLINQELFKLKDLVEYNPIPTDYSYEPENFIKAVIIPLEGTFDGTTREIVDVILRLRINGQYYSINNPPHFEYQDAAQTDFARGLTKNAKQNVLVDPATSDEYMPADNYNVYRYLVDTSSEIYFEMVLVKKDKTCTIMNIDKYGGILESGAYDDIIKLGKLPGTGKTHDVLSENNVKTTVKHKPYTENGYTPFVIPEKTSLTKDDLVLYSTRSINIEPIDTVEGELTIPFKLKVDFTSIDGFKHFGLSRNCRFIIKPSGVGSALEIETDYQKESASIDIGDKQIVMSVKSAIFYTWNSSLEFHFCVYVVSPDFVEPSQSVKNGIMEINGKKGYFSVSFENLLGVARKEKLPTIEVTPDSGLSQSSADDFNARYVTLFTSLELEGTKSSPPINTETGVWRIEVDDQA